MQPIFPDSRHPYYIVAPPFVRTSAGIRCFHLLCHCLNLRGQTAYLVPDPTQKVPQRGGTDLLTPILTDAIAHDHFERGYVPIIVYAETIGGNPYNMPCVVRYIANFPGLLGGHANYDQRELCYGFSASLAAAGNHPDNVLFIPSIDTRIFRLPDASAKRSGTCFFADKYKKIHGGKLFDVTADSVEILRQEKGEQTLPELVDLLQKSEIFYAYENTALAIEAALCGCATVFLPNPYLSDIISTPELGTEGYAWGDSPEEVARAKSTVAQAARNYYRQVENFWPALDIFIERTRAHVEGCVYEKPVELPADNILYIALVAIFRLLPSQVEREIAKALSTCGFGQLGSLVWNSAEARKPTRFGALKVSSKT